MLKPTVFLHHLHLAESKFPLMNYLIYMNQAQKQPDPKNKTTALINVANFTADK